MFNVTISADFFSSDSPDFSQRFDLSGLNNLRLEYEAELSEISDTSSDWYAIFAGSEATFASNRVVIGDVSANAIEIVGSNFSGVDSASDLVAQLETAIETANFEAINLYHNGVDVAELELDLSGYVLSSGGVSLSIGGSVPTSLTDIFALLNALTEITSGSLSPERLSEVLTTLSQYGVDEFSLSVSEVIDEETVETTLIAYSQSTTEIVFEAAGATFTITGDFPDNGLASIYDIYSDITAAFGSNSAASLDDITDFDITSVELTDANGDVVFSIEGDFGGIEVDDNGDVIEDSVELLDITIEGSDDADKEDEIQDVVFLDSEANSVSVNLNDGDDSYDLNGSLRDYVAYIGEDAAPTTIDGGDGFDTLAIVEGVNASDFIFADWEDGTITAIDGSGDTSYEVDFQNFERIDVHLESGGIQIVGDEGRNRVQLVQVNGYFEFDGGAGWDRLELHRVDNGDDAPRGFTLAELNAAFDFTLKASGEIGFSVKGDTVEIGVIENVEEIRLLVEGASDDRRDWDTEEYAVTEILGLEDFTDTPFDGTEGDDEISGNALDNTIHGFAGDDEIDGGGGDNTIDAGTGSDRVRVNAGNHELDGGDDDDWDSFRFTDETSEVVIVDFAKGQVIGQSSEDASDAYYLTSIENFDGIDARIDGHLIVKSGDGDEGRQLSLEWLPESFEFFGNADVYTVLSLRWVRHDDDSDYGFTRAEFEALFEFAGGDDANHIRILHKTGDNAGEVYADLWNVERIQFWAENREDRDEAIPSELAGITDFVGTDDDDVLDGNGLDNDIQGLDGDDRIFGEGDEGDGDTVDAGAGNDYIELEPGSHTVDGGDDFDVVNIRDYDSPVFIIDLEGGTISGHETLLGDADYETSITSVEGAVSNTNGDVYLYGTGDWFYLGVDSVPSYLEVDNGEGGGRISFRWTDNADGSHGITQADFEAFAEIVALDSTGQNFEVYAYDSAGERGDLIGSLTGVTQVEFLDPSADDGRNRVLISDIATYPEPIRGTDGDDTLVGTDGYDIIFGQAGDDDLSGGDGPDLLNPFTGDATLDGGAGDDVFVVVGGRETDDVVRISDPSGTDTLRIFDYQGLDSYEFIWDGNTATRITPDGHTTIIEGDNGTPVVEKIQWVGLNEDLEITYSTFLDLIVDQDDFTKLGVVFAGTNDDDVIAAPDLDSDSTDAFFGEIFGNGGDDEITVYHQFRYLIYGGDGDDTISVLDGDDVHSTADAWDEEPARQFVYGQDGNDLITTAGGDDTVWGGDGNDTISTGTGDDVVYGDGGDDVIELGSGSDSIDGGEGTDTLVVNVDAAQGDYVAEIDLTETEGNVGAVGVSEFRDDVSNIENVDFNGAVDVIVTSNGSANDISTGSGDDDIYLTRGTNDTVDGGDGEDLLVVEDTTSEVLVIDFADEEIRGQAGLGDDDEVYYTTEFANIETIEWANTNTVKLIGTGGSDVFSPIAEPNFLIVENGSGTGILDFTQIDNGDGSFGLNADELIVFTIVAADATGKKYQVFLTIDGQAVQVADLTGVSQARFLNAFDESEVLTHDISLYAYPFEMDVEGAPSEDATLSVDASLTGFTGPYTYQWQRDGEPIDGATGSTYTATQADVGAAISVVISGSGDGETFTTLATSSIANVNDAAAGTPTISGTAQQGETLTADISGVMDEDGTSTAEFTYQWQRDGLDIDGATGATFDLTQADVGSVMTVIVSFTDDFGNEESVSASTAEIANVNDDPAGTVTITGTPTEGQVLTAENTLEDIDGLGDFTYQWLRDGAPIEGATSLTYALTQADVGAQIAVRISYTDGQGTAEAVASAATEAVANVNDAPAGSVLISGATVEGETLTADASGLTDEDGLGDFTYQWLRDGTPIEGATALTYDLTQADVGAAIAVTVSYTDGQGADETVTSDATKAVGNVNTAPTGAVLISGDAHEGQTLTADVSGLADADGLGDFTYQWLADGAPISGQTGATLDVVAAYADTVISVQVSYTDGQGTEESVTSAATDAVLLVEINGTSDDDNLVGNSLNNIISGGAGDDTLSGQDGDDTLDGGSGSNQMDGGAGDDLYIVDDRDDTSFAISDASGDDTLTIVYSEEELADENWAWDGTTLTRYGGNGRVSTIGSVAGLPAIEKLTWIEPENFDKAGVAGAEEAPWNIVVDVEDFDGTNTMFVGSDEDDAIDVPSLTDEDADTTIVFLGGGDDTITFGTDFRFTSFGGAGDDVITEGTDETREDSTVGHWAMGQDGDDLITMGGGDNVILGGDGNDTIRDGGGDDYVEGGADNDQFYYTHGDSDLYDGGAGYDFIDVDLSDQADGFKFTIDLDDGAMGETDDLTDDLISIEGVRVIGDADVTVVGDAASNTIDLDAGNDSVDAGAGGDAVYAGAGNDTVNGGAGDDFIEGDLGNNVIDGGEGTDTALYAGAYDDYTIVEDGTGFDVTGSGLSDDVENVEIFSFSDQVFTAGMIRIGATNDGDEVGDASSSDSQELSSGGGDDLVTGGAGADTVDAGADNDTVDGGAGADTIDGGAGHDSVGGGAGDDEIFDGLGDDTIGGGEGADVGISLSGNNSFVEADEATDAADTSLDDYYAGGYGDDAFLGGGGNDVLVGDRGSAFYFGDDTMTGGTGDDILQGAGGADVFVFRSGDGDDTIGTVDLSTVGGATDITDVLVTGPDFEVGLDRVDLTDFGYASTADVLSQLSDVDGNAVLTTADGTITFIDIQSASLSADDFII